jgi:hypothetical protein
MLCLHRQSGAGASQPFVPICVTKLHQKAVILWSPLCPRAAFPLAICAGDIHTAQLLSHYPVTKWHQLAVAISMLGCHSVVPSRLSFLVRNTVWYAGCPHMAQHCLSHIGNQCRQADCVVGADTRLSIQPVQDATSHAYAGDVCKAELLVCYQ